MNLSREKLGIEKAIDAPVSRETVEKLALYATSLAKWQRSLNLISNKSLEDIWSRHFQDSAQLYRYLPENARSLVDMGSGGGFPGLVLAVLASERPNPLAVTLVDSDQRKCVFLRSVGHELGLSLDVQNRRLEDLDRCTFDLVTSRALAPLKALLRFGTQLSGPHSRLMFLKGKRWKEEVERAREHWTFDMEVVDSVTDSSGRVLIFEGVNAVK